LSEELGYASRGTSGQLSCGTEIETLCERSCTFLLEGLSGV
jgi:hypothetical protein